VETKDSRKKAQQASKLEASPVDDAQASVDAAPAVATHSAAAADNAGAASAADATDTSSSTPPPAELKIELSGIVSMVLCRYKFYCA
jgi:hypothetical protein